MEGVFGPGPNGLYLFLYVLPGILGALVFDYVVEGEPRSTLDRIGTVLVLTLITTLVTTKLFGAAFAPQISVTEKTSFKDILEAFVQPTWLFWSSVFAASAGLLFAVVENKNWVYDFLRNRNLTRKSGSADVWQQTFYLNFDKWVSLEFSDGRRLVGWPKRFSSSGQPRALLLADATWHVPDGDEFYSLKVDGPGVYVFKFDDVVSMQFLN